MRNRAAPSSHRESPPPSQGVITAITHQAHDPERVSVFLDGVFAFGITRMLAAEHGLAVGDELSEERVAMLRALDQEQQALEAAFRLLTRRPRSEREIRERLERRGFPPPVIETVIGKLAAWRYVDDEAFARYWVEQREANRPRGRRLLAQELRHKGIDREVIREALDDADIDELAAARSLGEAKLLHYRQLEPSIVRRRLGAYLMRKGFSYETVRAVMRDLLADSDESKEIGGEA
ncbi:MAG: regulatory protein RecX [Thermomicrobiales bacterium]|nr:MAG: regulatory protein RecX [Thermomicrobiales bacterium]